MIDLTHPTPQFRRDSFLSLDGEWQANEQTIRVPYPPQASASGWQGPVPDNITCHRRFTLPGGFPGKGRRLLLHFGAVDQVAYVFLNDRPVMMHEGGYLPFEADITELVRPGENDLMVEAVDTLSHDYPWGKQSLRPKGMWYTPVSGIWQSVWLEAVPEKRIRRLRVMPDLTGITIRVDGDGERAQLSIAMPDGGTVSASVSTGCDERIEIPQPRCWSPEDPYLYELEICSGEDRVQSYFALRTVSFGEDAAGVKRLQLNGKPVFLSAVLDQGYFPEGIYTALSPEAWAEEAARVQHLGFNCIRKHIKIEPEAFYTACDTSGVLVLQDMVNSGGYSWFFDTALPNLGFQHRPDWLPGDKRRRAFFEKHCRDTQAHLWNHPCVIGYTIFNEGWGQYHTGRLYEMLKGNDPSRFYDSTSGWFRGYPSDVDSRHVYFRNRRLRPGKRPMLLSECGGYSRAVEGHLFLAGEKYGYGEESTEQALTDRIEKMLREMVMPAIPGGLMGYVYTQITDVEGEINGLYTYDRQVCKVDAGRIRTLNQACTELLQKAAGG